MITAKSHAVVTRGSVHSAGAIGPTASQIAVKEQRVTEEISAATCDLPRKVERGNNIQIRGASSPAERMQPQVKLESLEG